MRKVSSCAVWKSDFVIDPTLTISTDNIDDESSSPSFLFVDAVDDDVEDDDVMLDASPFVNMR